MSITDGIGGSGFNMKAKIQALEQCSKAHDEEFERVYQQLESTNVTVKENDQTCHELFKKNDDRITTEINAVKDEMVHRFTLQTAENKRLQNHITNLKQENQALERRLFALEERVKHLEIEVGGGEDDEIEQNF
eukprot:CAMPEP_0117755618 /NCGR_PEP_ID=MMETSP0947-20121206/13558_1 /TAXON_ID=44440 /ORGANISM="Chattonella subsalsa, Strain CCMP2191" /LENGTH=133 /DNA_ID=CAMNT_0005574985 /DNA_START=245 /DNA_END=646 /DNA_ORIENTATION=-